MGPILTGSMQFEASKSVVEVNQSHSPNPDLELREFILLKICNPGISVGLTGCGRKMQYAYRMLGVQMGKSLVP